MPRFFQCESKIDSQGRGAMHCSVRQHTPSTTHTLTGMATLSRTCAKCLCDMLSMSVLGLCTWVRLAELKAFSVECGRDPSSP